MNARRRRPRQLLRASGWSSPTCDWWSTAAWVDAAERKIGLSKKRAEWSAEQEADSESQVESKPRRGGLSGSFGGEDTTDLISHTSLSGVPSTATTTSKADVPPAEANVEAEAKEEAGTDADSAKETSEDS